MSDANDPIRILMEELDEEVLSRMPDWFRTLREAYKKQKMRNVDRDARTQSQEGSC